LAPDRVVERCGRHQDHGNKRLLYPQANSVTDANNYDPPNGKIHPGVEAFSKSADTPSIGYASDQNSQTAFQATTRIVSHKAAGTLQNVYPTGHA
jgi:hypothetical protein